MTNQHRPNAIIIMVDQMKATASHLYSRYGIATPGLERLAKMGVRYTNATTPHPLCVPARVAMWTAKKPQHTGAFSNKTPVTNDMTHAASWWRDAGYQLALLGKNHCFADQSDRDLFTVWCEIEHYGLKDRLPDPASPRGMAWVESEDKVTAAHAVRNNMPAPQGGPIAYATTEFEDCHYSTGLLSNQADAFLRQQSEPFALWLSFPDPHVPYETPKHFYEQAAAQHIELPPPGPVPGKNMPMRNRLLSQMMRWPDDQVDDLQNVVTAYLANVLHIDAAVNHLLDTLVELDKLDNTIIVFCSDHGDFAGEHQMAAKGGVFYDCLVRIPMIVVAPGIFPANEVVESPVSLLDIIPTLFQLQGISLPEPVDGQPIVPCPGAVEQQYGFSLYGAGGPSFTPQHLEDLEQSPGHRALLKTVKYREQEGKRSMIRSPDWKFVHDSMGDLDELYDLKRDPYEHNNLAYVPGHETIRETLLLELRKWRQWE